MTSPYRAEPPPIARYVLRTNPRFTSQLRGALAVSALLLAIAGTYWSGAKRDPAAWILVVLAVAVPLGTFVFGSVARAADDIDRVRQGLDPREPS